MADLDHQTASGAGTLWVVATPIGHLDDLSPRAQHILASVPVVAAEDTRVSRRLVAPVSDQRWISVNEHNESERIQALMDWLLDGQDVALVSDAGTPLISDPGYRLVSAAHRHGIRVSPIPGPSAAIAALSVSGLPCDRFFFEGFLPAKSKARQTRLHALSELTSTWIIYVPARDLVEVLEDMVCCIGPERPITLARELTKQFETVVSTTIEKLLQRVINDPDQLRGEAVCVVHGRDKPLPAVSVNTLAQELKEALPPSQAARVLARVSGVSRKAAWTLINPEFEQEEQGPQ